MTVAAIYDTHAAIQIMERAGISREHAVAITEVVTVSREGYATHDDLTLLESNLRREIVVAQKNTVFAIIAIAGLALAIARWIF